MNAAVRTIIYGNAAECGCAADVLRGFDCFAGGDIRCVDSWNLLQQDLEQFRPELLVVLAAGAAGMEGVYLARQTCPEMPVFWFSDDCGFGMQSHRLECEYFTLKPLTDEKLRKALRHCDKTGIRI